MTHGAPLLRVGNEQYGLILFPDWKGKSVMCQFLGATGACTSFAQYRYCSLQHCRTFFMVLA